MKRLSMRFLYGVRQTWWWVRQVSGDAAYENYARRQSLPMSPRRSGRLPMARGQCSRQAVGHLLSPEEFYVDRLQRKYAGVSRCC